MSRRNGLPCVDALRPAGLAGSARNGYMSATIWETGMIALIQTIVMALDIYWWIIIASAIFSWLYAFNVVNSRNQFVGTVGNMLYRLTEPALRPIRRFMPDLGGIDISPIILLLIIYFIQSVIIRYIYPNVF